MKKSRVAPFKTTTYNLIMSEKSNFYVFEKKEILLVVLFVVLVAVTSFLFGLKIGSTYSFEDSGYDENQKQILNEETKKVEFISKEEEKVKTIISEDSKKEGAKERDINKELQESLKNKIINEFSDENKKFQADAPKKSVAQEVPMEATRSSADLVSKEVLPEPDMENVETAQTEGSGDKFSGKYTVQLAAFQTISEAKEFAEGFKVLGYSPIINEKEIEGRGNWFRVSLGVFDNLAMAKDYILKNKSLFAERDYVFRQFD